MLMQFPDKLSTSWVILPQIHLLLCCTLRSFVCKTQNEWYVSHSHSVQHPEARPSPKSEQCALAGCHHAPTVLFLLNCTLSTCGEQVDEENTQRILLFCYVSGSFCYCKKMIAAPFLVLYYSEFKLEQSRGTSNRQISVTAITYICVCVQVGMFVFWGRNKWVSRFVGMEGDDGLHKSATAQCLCSHC